MKRLGGTDALFLSLETPSWHQHVGGLSIIEPEERAINFDDVLLKVDERLPYAPKFKWKLKETPFGLDRPMWVDDEEFDVRRHVRRIGVPSPGGAKELGEVVGTLMSSQLDRRRPLWELWFIEGLAGGKVAIFLKYHHALLDGVAGASLATVLLDLDPHATAPLAPLPNPEDTRAGAEPSDLTLVARTVLDQVRRPVRVARYLAGMAGKGVAALQSMTGDEENRAILKAPVTPFNGPVGPRRELAFASLSMQDVHQLKVKHDVKVNDVVLAVTAGALRRYLDKHDALPDSPLVTAVPVSTRPEGDKSMDNQISNMFVSLATDVEDPVERLQAIRRSTQSAKAMRNAIGAREIQSIGEVASPLILGSAIRTIYRTSLMTRIPLRVNTVVSNVPGPNIPLYMCGGKVVAIFPSSVILEGMGLNVTVISYLDRVDFGVHVDPDLIPDVWVLANEVPAALAELMDASGLGRPTPVHMPLPGEAGVSSTGG
ncbi:MAG TPA: wax ester/triacylglycerol synthase family O-acyltransferase [Acidimicrobiales bacterium]|nr:wax ester/triacylglycerol synthase family O-acyltransferase [Acidimicrobiales bacterium]